MHTYASVKNISVTTSCACMTKFQRFTTCNKTIFTSFTQGPVVQNWVKANPGLKISLKPVFQLLYFYPSVYFGTLKMKTLIDPDKMPQEIFQNSQRDCRTKTILLFYSVYFHIFLITFLLCSYNCNSITVVVVKNRQ